MPYIKQTDRTRYDAIVAQFVPFCENKVVSAGDLNYLITRLVTAWAAKNYTGIALATGVLENVKQEFYRRVASPYEDAKIAENGDVY